MDALPRKRTRYCPHCDEDVTHLVYKKHKEEFTKRAWMSRRYKTNFEELDAEDDDIIRETTAVNAGRLATYP